MRDPFLTSPVLNISSKIDHIRKAHMRVGGLKCNFHDPIDENLGATPSAGNTAPPVALPVLNIGSKVECVRWPHIHIGGLKCDRHGPIDESLGATRKGRPWISMWRLNEGSLET